MSKSTVTLTLKRVAQSSISQKLRLSLFAIFATFTCLSTASAKDLQGRLGLGYNAEFVSSTSANGVPAISLKYGFTRDLAGELIFGIATTTPGSSVSGVKFFKNIFFENNLNFYFMLGGALVSAGGASGSQFIGGFGVEFFIPGVDSLGFSMETGASFDNLSGTFAMRTLGMSFLNAGMHFYF